MDKAKVARVIRQVRKWNLAVWQYSLVDVVGENPALFANAKSGSRGGRLKNCRHYMMTWDEMLAVQQATNLQRHPAA